MKLCYCMAVFKLKSNLDYVQVPFNSKLFGQ